MSENIKIRGGELTNFPYYISTSEHQFTVMGYIGGNITFEDERGYIDPSTGNVFIFSSTKPKSSGRIPRVWYDNSGELRFSLPNPDYHEDKLLDYSFDTIVKSTKEGEQLYDEQAIADMNDASSFYVPIINKEDDFLKIIVKTIILKKGIDINRLKCKMDTKYGLVNLKSALINKTKMSVVNFRQWMELLGCEFEIIIKDDGSDTIDPLKEDVHYLSITNKAE